MKGECSNVTWCEFNDNPTKHEKLSVITLEIYFNLEVSIGPFAGFEVLQRCMDTWEEPYNYAHLFGMLVRVMQIKKGKLNLNLNLGF